MGLLLRFALLDPDFYNGLIGPALILIAVVVGAKAYKSSKTTEAGIATSSLLRDELTVARERGDRLAEELTICSKALGLAESRTNLEPVMAGISDVMTGLTAATQEMVAEIRASAQQAVRLAEEASKRDAERYDKAMQKIEAHETRAQERHEKMMVPLERLAEDVGRR